MVAQSNLLIRSCPHEYIVAVLKEMDFPPSSFMLHHHQTHHEDSDHHQPHTSLTPNILSLPQDFHGVASFLGNKRSSMSFSAAGIHHQQVFHQETNIGNGNGNMGDMVDDHLSDEDDDEEGSQAGGEKKRRLNLEQVRTLEKNFELGNKLDPERKLQLARALGLQPRQIAIWFQNRRARCKIKQLEKDYQRLKAQFQALEHERDSLQSHNHKLHAQILALKNRDEEPTELINLNKEIDESACSNRSENSSDISRRRTAPANDSHPNFIRQPSPCHAAHQLFKNNSSSAIPDHHHQTVKEESFSGMFCGINDQTGLWPWLEQQQFS